MRQLVTKLLFPHTQKIQTILHEQEESTNQSSINFYYITILNPMCLQYKFCVQHESPKLNAIYDFNVLTGAFKNLWHTNERNCTCNMQIFDDFFFSPNHRNTHNNWFKIKKKKENLLSRAGSSRENLFFLLLWNMLSTKIFCQKNYRS